MLKCNQTTSNNLAAEMIVKEHKGMIMKEPIKWKWWAETIGEEIMVLAKQITAQRDDLVAERMIAKEPIIWKWWAETIDKEIMVFGQADHSTTR
jgi:hypothetical protein